MLLHVVVQNLIFRNEEKEVQEVKYLAWSHTSTERKKWDRYFHFSFSGPLYFSFFLLTSFILKRKVSIFGISIVL